MTHGTDAARVRRLGLLALVVLAIVAVALALRSCDDTDGPRSPRAAEAQQTKEVEVPGRDDRTRRRVDAVDAASQSAPSTDGPPSPVRASPAPGAMSKRTVALSPSWQKLDLARHKIEGRTVSPGGEPLAGVEVTLVSTWLDGETQRALLARDAHSRSLASSQTTGVDGTFRLEYVEGGARNLVVGNIAQPSVVAEVRPGEFHEVVVPTEPRTLVVTVLGPDGHPMAGVDVWVSAVIPWSPSPLSSTAVFAKSGVSDENGVARIADATVGPVELRLHRQGTTMMPQIHAADVKVAGESAVTVRLAREVPVRVVVLDAESGEPLSQAFAFDRSRMALSAFSDAQGHLELRMPLAPRVAQSLTIDHADYAATTVLALIREEPTDDTVCEVQTRLQRSASVALRCVDVDGTPIRHVTVIARSAYIAAARPIRTIDVDTAAGQTGGDGRTAVHGLHPGGGLPLQVTVMRAGVVILDREFPSLQAGETRDLGEIVVAAGRTLTGRVLDPEGNPVVGAIVIAVPRRPDADEDSWRPGLAGTVLTGQGRRSDSGADGSFAIGGMPPGLVDVLVVEPPPGLLHEGVSLTSGSDPAPLVLRLPRTITIRGRVLSADGSPVEGATILFPIPGPVDLHATQDTITDGEGRFELPGFAADTAPFDVQVIGDAGDDSQTRRIDPATGEVTSSSIDGDVVLERDAASGDHARMREAVLETIRGLPHFGGLDDATIERLADASRVLRPKTGSLIVHEGEPCRAFFAVRKGAVRVFRVAPDGRMQILHRLGPGRSFAEAAVLNMGNYPANAEAIEDGTEVVEIGAATFLTLFDTDRRMPRIMVSSLCGWLRELVGRVEELSVHSAGARLARFLLDLPARDTEAGLEIVLPTSKKEIAERLGITPETLSRQLRRWHDHEVIVSQRDRMVLLKADTLLSIAAES